MRIYSKKAFALGPGATPNSDKVESVITVPCAFQDIDDSLVNDLTFILALKAGDITIVDRKPTVTVEYTNTSDTEEFDEEDAISKFKTELKLAKPEDVKKLADKYGAEFRPDDKLGQNKQRVFEAYKLHITAEARTSNVENTEEASEE